MAKKLPGIYQCENATSYNNMQEKCYCSSCEEVREEKIEQVPVYKQSIESKIKNIFNSPTYVYKADVKITMNNEVVNKTIIGRNKTHLITVEKELIPISEVKDITQ